MSSSKEETKKDLDRAFQLIEEGHAFRKETDHWSASRSYAEAAVILESLYHHQQETAEGKKIAKLYHDKAVEYLKSARLSLAEALQQDAETDVTHVKDSTLSSTNHSLSDVSKLLQDLNDADCQKRLELFGRLFAKEIPSTTPEAGMSDIEARLMQLNSNIPNSLKTEAERIRDLNRGLRRLGLATVESSANTTPSAFNALSVEPPKSESDQVVDIINQMKAEVTLNAALTTTDDDGVQNAANGVIADQPDDEADDPSDDDDTSSEEDDNDDVDLTADTCRTIHEKLLSVEVSLAELIALFEVDEGGDAEIEFDQQRGRHLLRSAMGSLKAVQTKWNAAG